MLVLGAPRLWLEPRWGQAVFRCTAVLHRGRRLQAFPTCANPDTQTQGPSLSGLQKVCRRKVGLRTPSPAGPLPREAGKSGAEPFSGLSNPPASPWTEFPVRTLP